MKRVHFAFFAVVALSVAAACSSNPSVPSGFVPDGASQFDGASQISGATIDAPAGTEHVNVDKIPWATPNAIQNGGFESGSLFPWQACGSSSSNMPVAVSKRHPHSGRYDAVVGNISTKSPEFNGPAAVCQAVTIPANATLTVWTFEATDDIRSRRVAQFGGLYDRSGHLQKLLFAVRGNQRWRKWKIGLKALAGQNLVLVLGVVGSARDRGKYIAQYVDDVSLTAGPTPTPSPTPTPFTMTGTMYATTKKSIAPGVTGDIEVYTAFHASAIGTISGSTSQVSDPGAIAVTANGTIYVANGSGDGTYNSCPDCSITGYAANTYGDVAPIVSTTNTIGWVSGVQADSLGDLFVAQVFSPSEVLTPAGGGTFTVSRTFTTSGNVGSALALDSSGQIYIASSYTTASATANEIDVWAAGTTGSSSAIGTISGSNTGLSEPAGIAFDGSGNMYVANGQSVTVYSAGTTNGNATPIRTISGSSTTFSSLSSVALDAKGYLYVGDFGNGNIDVFAPGANGNVAPIATMNVPSLQSITVVPGTAARPRRR